jgi:TonB-dependent starch-binding outer membrane protein SusC
VRGATTIVACLVVWGSTAACGRGGAAPSPDVRPGQVRVGSDGVGGATDSLSAELVEQEHFADLAAMMQGRVPGLQITRFANGDVSLRIRGTSSLNQPQGDPLVVIDGLPVLPGNLSFLFRTLDPHDIESIRVLKDVASTSVYGMRGAHGVVVIETKR